jgi:sugar transferase/cyclophilin type peptidyl-prolyl cis-trans isomerase/CLD
VWGVAERPSKLAAEVGAGELGCTGEVVYAQRLEVAGIREILGAQKVAVRWDKRHAWPVCRAVPLLRRPTSTRDTVRRTTNATLHTNHGSIALELFDADAPKTVENFVTLSMAGPLGSLLRRWSLDELPQLWNVVRGEMSVVGPRPEVPPVVATYPEHATERHLVRPGLTGLWKVTARDVKPMQANVGMDVDYVRRVLFWLDVRILLRTVPAIVGSARTSLPDSLAGS